MRRIVLGFMGTLSGLVLLFSYHTSTSSKMAVAGGTTGTTPSTAGSEAAAPSAAPTTGTSSSSSSGASGSSGSSGVAAAPAPTTSAGSAAASGAGTYTGSAVNTRWGIVQVQITVAGGKVTVSNAVQYPQNNSRDRQINAYAVPTLNQEAVSAQSANIDTVSGATVTSDGYLQSLQSALNQANL